MDFIAKTLYGLEAVLAGELKLLGASDVTMANRAVMFTGDKELLYRVNYRARTALSVLMKVAGFNIRSADDLYRNSLKIEWDRYFSVRDTFSVVPVVNSELFNHSGFAGLRLKDAVADYFRKKTGRRPSVDQTDPGTVINLHISHSLVTVSLDSSGYPLFKRGYREKQSSAPVNEVLAAGMILLSGWDGTVPLLDPMCGSGTIPVEAGLIACRIPPGKFRQSFGFMNWRDFDNDLLKKVIIESDCQIKEAAVMIYGRDISGSSIEMSKANVERAGLSGVVTIELADFAHSAAPFPDGYIFMNPPYGQRLKPEDIESLYAMIGTSLKHNYPGFTAYILTSYPEASKKIGLRTKEKKILYNGALECNFLKYELYFGSRKFKNQMKSY
jgi:putative N6-adenine-specific DNA methylase